MLENILTIIVLLGLGACIAVGVLVAVFFLSSDKD
jgi:hypothetical protein